MARPRLGQGGQSPRFRPRVSLVGSPSQPANVFTRRPQLGSGGVTPPTIGGGRPIPGVTGPSARQTAPPEGIAALIGPQYQRPQGALQMLLRAIRIPENIIAGYMQAVWDGQEDGEQAPWMYLKALGLGFKDIPTGIRENATFEEFILETRNPNSFLYKKANLIGLGMAVFFDPITYLTFGTTGASKIAAKHALARGWQTSEADAVKYMASGTRHPQTGKRYSPSDDVDLVRGEIHLATGRPFDLGDALMAVREIDRTSGGIYRRAFPRGGRGTRFMGHEIPGTVGLGQKMADAIRGRTTEVLSAQGTTAWAARAFVPDAKLKAISHDATRALALVEFRRIETATGYMAEQMAKESTDIARLVQNDTARSVGRIFGAPIEYIPQAERAGVLRGATPTSAALHRMYSAAHRKKDSVVQAARREGFSEGQLEEADKLWETLARQIDDPVEVVAQFQLRVMGRVMAHQHIRNILENTMFARRVDPDMLKRTEGLTVLSVEAFEQITRSKARPFKYGGKTYAVRDEVYEALSNIKNPKFIDKELSKAFALANSVQQLWKIPATVLNPAFHMMNTVGGMWNNMLAGPYGPLDYVEAFARVAQKRVDEHVSRGILTKPLRALGPKLPGAGSFEEKTRQRAFEAFESRGAGGRGFVSAELTVGKARQAAKGAGERPMLPKRARGERFGIETGRAFTAARRATAGLGVAEIATDIAAYEGWIDDFDIPFGNEFWGVIGFLPEFAKFGRHTASYVEEVLRLTPFQEAWKDKSLQQLMEVVGPITPANFAKTAPKGLTKKQEGALFDLGAEMAVHFQFDYSKLTDVERLFAKSIFPFYTFYKNNFLLQAREIINRPRFVDTFYDVANYVSDEGEDQLTPEFKKILPEYFDDLGAFQLPVPNWAREKLGLPPGPLFLNPKLPFVSLNLFPPLWELANNRSVTPFWQRALQVASPTLGSVGPFAPVPVPGAKLALEAALGYNLGLSRPLDYQRASSGDWRESFTPAPGYLKYIPTALREIFGVIQDEDGRLVMPATNKFVMDNMSTPFITNYGKAVPPSFTGTRGDKARADLVAWMTGLRLMPVDPVKISRSWGYRMESMLAARKATLRTQGQQLEPEDELTLRRVRTLLKQVEDLWEIREKELYG